MPHLPSPVADATGLVALAALLVTAHRHPRPRTEALAGVAAVALVLLAGLVDVHETWDAVRPLLPVVGFLVAILVVADVCARAGLFRVAARVVQRHSAGRPQALLLGIFVVALVVTTVLSLDATVVLLTPVVVVAARQLELSPRPAAYACLRMANSGSLLLPVSNLTNLLAVPHLGLSFTGFAARMALPQLATLVVEYAGLRLVFRDELSAPAGPVPPPLPRQHVEPVPLVTVAVMLAGFAVLSPVGVEPCWPAGAAALVLVAWAHRRGLIGVRAAVHAGHPSFVVLVLGLGVVVAGLAEGFLGDTARHLLPHSTSYAALLAIAGIATVSAALFTNLSATLLLVPIVAPIGTTAVLAALLGLGIGAGLTWTGSLANLLWRRTLVRHGIRPSQRAFHRVSLTLTPVSLVAATAALWLVT